jgi:hypothetical protein
MLRIAIAAALTLALSSAGADADVIRSKKTGVTAHVAQKYAAEFQAYIDAIEAEGAAIHYMTGVRKGRCSVPRSKHPCGMALDVCQDARGKVSRMRNCRLPPPARLAAIAKQFGLIEGGGWCNSDYGHVEVRSARQAEGCKRNLFAAVARWKEKRTEGTALAASMPDTSKAP